MLQTPQTVFRIVPKFPKMSLNVPQCLKMSTSDASLSERTSFFFKQILSEIECQSHPCEHGSCNDGVDSYTCLCEAGYFGDNCELGKKELAY